MLSVQEPEFRWGVAGWQTQITGRLFTDEVFTFRKGAEDFIGKAKALFASENRPIADDEMFPVLLKVSTSICSEEETMSYDREQKDWLEKHGQAAKRRRKAEQANI